MVLQIHPKKIRSIPEISVRVKNSETGYEEKVKRNKCVFSLDLKVLSEFAVLTDKGREFQTFGPATEKALLPISLLV